MKNIYIGMAGIISSAIIYGFYHLAYIMFNYGSTNWGGYRYIMARTDGVIYQPLIISIVLFIAGVYFLYKGIKGK